MEDLEDFDQDTSSRSAILVMSILALATLGWGYWTFWHESIPDLIAEAEEFIEAEEFNEAAAVTQKLINRAPEDLHIQWLAAQSSHGQEKHDVALRHLKSIDNKRSEHFIDARFLEGDIYLFELFDLEHAEGVFQGILKSDEGNGVALNRLAFIQGFGMQDQAFRKQVLRMMSQSRFEMVQLCLLVLGSERLFESQNLAPYYKANPDDPFLQLPKAYQEWKQGEPQQAVQRLKTEIESGRGTIEIWEMLGKISLEEKMEGTFNFWLDHLPAEIQDESDIWFLKGQSFRMKGQRSVAIRCFYECVRANPSHREALYQLGQLLTQHGMPQEAAPFLDRGEKLRAYEDTVTNVWNTRRLSDMRLAAQQANDLTLQWEHFGWISLIQLRDPENIDEMIELTNLQIEAEEWELIRTRYASPTIPLEDFHRPPSTIKRETETQSASAKAGGSVSFKESAQQVGLNFSYHTVGDPEAGLYKMYEVLGAGVSILDYDRDGCPDVYHPQSCDWPPDAQATTILDQLFRNLDGKEFENVTTSSGILESGYSHSAIIGDINNDGFADICVTNIGSDRLFFNNGDGTFSEQTKMLGNVPKDWSVGGAFADFDGDGDLDIYLVNYLEGDDVFTRVCNSGGKPHSCQPQVFQPARDLVLENLGNGSWRNVSHSVGTVRENSNSLGIVVADLNADSRIDVFVANDVAPNHLYLNQPGTSEQGWVFSEQGIQSGLSVNVTGTEEACMGVAVGDVDGDQLLDLFVTNFENETNTFYRQVATGLFEDVTTQIGLSEPSRPVLGFGTELIDADNDGWLDLIVTNGHINHFHRADRPYKMTSQFFRNDHGNRFKLERPAQLGEFFATPILGRGLVQFDWNKDGLSDVLISRIDGPTSLLTNDTRTNNRSLQIWLTGTVCNRDAIGATVVLHTDRRKILSVLTGSGGYMSCNEACLQYGLSQDEKAQTLEVTWPGGQKQFFNFEGQIGQVLCVEGSKGIHSF